MSEEPKKMVTRQFLTDVLVSTLAYTSVASASLVFPWQVAAYVAIIGLYLALTIEVRK